LQDIINTLIRKTPAFVGLNAYIQVFAYMLFFSKSFYYSMNLQYICYAINKHDLNKMKKQILNQFYSQNNAALRAEFRKPLIPVCVCVCVHITLIPSIFSERSPLDDIHF